MPTMTKKHFVWLAKEVAPLVYQDKIGDFVQSVKNFSGNPHFDKQRFTEALEKAWLDQRAENDIGPEDYKW